MKTKRRRRTQIIKTIKMKRKKWKKMPMFANHKAFPHQSCVRTGRCREIWSTTSKINQSTPRFPYDFHLLPKRYAKPSQAKPNFWDACQGISLLFFTYWPIGPFLSSRSCLIPLVQLCVDDLYEITIFPRGRSTVIIIIIMCCRWTSKFKPQHKKIFFLFFSSPFFSTINKQFS